MFLYCFVLSLLVSTSVMCWDFQEEDVAGCVSSKCQIKKNDSIITLTWFRIQNLCPDWF